MTNTDKTRQKLVDSMRKTKAETEAGTETKTSSTKASTPKAASAPTTKKTRARRVSTKSTADAGSVTPKPSATSTKPEQIRSDPYQGGRRVWPD